MITQQPMMRMLTFAGLLVTTSFLAQAKEDSRSEATTLVAVNAQDEPRKLPKDITAQLTRADRRVRFELVKLSGDSSLSLAGTSVTVIDPDGKTTNIIADEQGVAVLEDAKPGLNALAIGGAQGHTAMPFAVREADGDVAAAAGPATLKLPLVDVEPKEVISLARASRPSADTVALSDIDTDFVSTGSTGDAFGYRFRLGTQGVLFGQVLSLVRGGIASGNVEGTRVMVYSGSILAGQAVADQRGYFSIPGMASGVYGLIAAGPGGYAAFAFEAIAPQAIATTSSKSAMTLVSVIKADPVDGDLVPVVLVPPAMVETMVVSLEQSYGGLIGGDAGAAMDAGMGAAALSSLGASLAGAGSGAAGGGGSAGGGAAGAGGIGGIGALGSLVGIGAVAAAVASDSNSDPGPNASPSDFKSVELIPSTLQ